MRGPVDGATVYIGESEFTVWVAEDEDGKSSGYTCDRCYESFVRLSRAEAHECVACEDCGYVYDTRWDALEAVCDDCKDKREEAVA